jgi:hypothetical protein
MAKRLLTIGAALFASLAILSATPWGVEAQQTIRNIVVDEGSLLVTEMTRAADGIDDIEAGLSLDVAHGNTFSDQGPQGMLEAADFDGSALPNSVSEGQAARAKSSMSGIAYTMLVSEDG